MTKNVGGADRVVRILFGLAILGAGWFAQSWWGLLGLIPLATGSLGICPAYLPFGIDTTCVPKGSPKEAEQKP